MLEMLNSLKVVLRSQELSRQLSQMINIDLGLGFLQNDLTCAPPQDYNCLCCVFVIRAHGLGGYMFFGEECIDPNSSHGLLLAIWRPPNTLN